jgi:hypothetical protein
LCVEGLVVEEIIPFIGMKEPGLILLIVVFVAIPGTCE